MTNRIFGKSSISRRNVLIGSALTLCTPTILRAQERTLVINSFGGSYERAVRTAFADPFTAQTGVKVAIQTATSLESVARVRAQAGSPDMDIVTADMIPVTPLLIENLVEELDTSKLNNFNLLYPGTSSPDARWVSPHVGSIGVVYNTNLASTPPTSWLDFWSPDFAGKVALPDMSLSWGPLYLVAMARAMGGSETDVEGVFTKLKELKPSIHSFYKAPDALVALLNQDEVAISVWASDRAFAAKAAGSPVEYATLKEGPMRNMATMVIPRGARNKDVALDFINFVISTDRQTEFCTLMGYGPTNREVVLPPEIAATVPYGEAQVAALQGIDLTAAVSAWPNWLDRWNREITN